MSLRACRACPSRGARSNGRWPSGERPGDNADGDFLGGARSPRPRGTAVRKARHIMIIRGKGTLGGLMEPSLGESEVSLAGVRSPPLPDADAPKSDGLAGKGLKIRDFLGGTQPPRPRILAGRKPGISSTGNARREADWPTGHVPRWSRSLPCGRAEPPSAGQAWARSLAGKTRRERGWWFSRRGAVSASGWDGRASAKALHSDQIR